jgi:alpha-aminoadipic semialdehyde synthase
MYICRGDAMIGIRREDKNEWERRVPLTPEHVSRVREAGVDVTVETSVHRAYPDADYRTTGVGVSESTGPSRVVLGIKEVAIDRLAADTTYLFFSHTTKGQAHNMPMLRRLMQLGCTLLDYELIADAQDRRLIFFGRHAGYAGMIDALWALGQRLALDGFDTPFRRIEPAHRYATLADALDHLGDVGRELTRDGLPDGLDPIVCGFIGTGRPASTAGATRSTRSSSISTNASDTSTEAPSPSRSCPRTRSGSPTRPSPTWRA